MATGADELAASQELEVARTCLEFIRDVVLISRGDGNLLDALIFTAALDANMAPVDRAPDLGVIYGGVDSSAPDDLRRAVAMYAVAQSLGLPAETVRRRFAGLVRSGACVMTPRGIIVPRAAVVSSPYKAIQRARYERAYRFREALRVLNALPEAELVQPETDEPLIRAANRALSEYTLRACRRLLSLTGDVISSLVLMELALDNTRGMDGGVLAQWVRDPMGPARPVRIISLSHGLPLSRETVRRHVGTLTHMGFCRRTPLGLVAVTPPRAVSPLAALFTDNRADLNRLFRRLAALGAFAEWDAQG